MRQRVWLTGLCTALLFGVAACTPAGDEGQAERDPRNTAHRFNRDDGYHGITNANPNMWVGDWYAPTKTDDARRMERIVLHVPGVRDATVVFAGGRVLLGIVPDPAVKADRYPALEREVRDRVTASFPRYDVTVTIDPRSRYRLPIRRG